MPNDGLLSRTSGRWAKDKLGILALYASEFTRASTKAQATYFVDGLAGPGLCRVDRPEEYVEGSTLIGARAFPQFTKCLAMDLRDENVRALAARTAPYGSRIVVRRGNVNVDLLPFMHEQLTIRTAPMLIFLDPEGFEVDWATVRALSQFRQGDRKAELLMLAMTSMISRVVAARDQTAAPGRLHWALPPGPGWLEIAQQQEAGEITAESARKQWANLYETQLKTELGYADALVRPITRGGSPTDPTFYHLVFASDHPAGKRIMEHAFQHIWINQPPEPPAASQGQFDLL